MPECFGDISELAIFGLKFFKLIVAVIIHYPQSSSAKLADFLLGGSTTGRPYKRVILKLCFKKRLKEYPWLLKY